MFEGIILRQLTSDDLHRPLSGKEVVSVVLFLMSFSVFALVLLVPAGWLRWTAGFVIAALLPFYVTTMVRVFRKYQRGTQRVGSESDHAA